MARAAGIGGGTCSGFIRWVGVPCRVGETDRFGAAAVAMAPAALRRLCSRVGGPTSGRAEKVTHPPFADPSPSVEADLDGSSGVILGKEEGGCTETDVDVI